MSRSEARCGLRVTGYGLRVARCEVRGAGCELRVTSYGLRVTGCGIESIVLVVVLVLVLEKAEYACKIR